MLLLLGAASAVVQSTSQGPAMLELDYAILPTPPVGAQCMLSGVLGDSWVLSMGNRANALWDEAGWPRPSWARPAGGCWTGGYSLSLKDGGTWSAEVPLSPSCVKDTHCAGECVFSNKSHWPTCSPALLEETTSPVPCCTGTCGNYVGTGATPKIVLSSSQGDAEALVMAGGFSHVSDTAAVWAIWRKADQMGWTQLPSLPYAMSTAGLTAVGSKLVVVGSAGSKQSVWSTINGTERGRKTWVLDLLQPNSSWVAGPDLPGTPRSGGVVIAVNSSVFVLGGLADSTGPTPTKPVNCSGLNAGVSLKTCRATVLDNWVLDTATMVWSQLPTNPHAHGGMSPSAVVFKNRYIINLGVDCKAGSAGNVEMCLHGLPKAEPGCVLKKNFGPDTTINASCLKIPPPETTPIGYCNGIAVYDTHTSTWGSVKAQSTSQVRSPTLTVGCSHSSLHTNNLPCYCPRAKR